MFLVQLIIISSPVRVRIRIIARLPSRGECRSFRNKFAIRQKPNRQKTIRQKTIRQIIFGNWRELIIGNKLFRKRTFDNLHSATVDKEINYFAKYALEIDIRKISFSQPVIHMYLKVKLLRLWAEIARTVKFTHVWLIIYNKFGPKGLKWTVCPKVDGQTERSRTIVNGLLSKSGRPWVKVDSHST